jgi:hypothetical protein
MLKLGRLGMVFQLYREKAKNPRGTIMVSIMDNLPKLVLQNIYIQ